MSAPPAVAVLTADLLQVRRRAFGLGPGRLLGTLLAGALLIAAEVWIADRVVVRLGMLPSALAPAGRWILLRGALLVGQLAFVVGAASAVSLALPQLEALEGDPWLASCPTGPASRAAQAVWRVLGGLGWVVVLALPPLLRLAAALAPGPTVMAATAGGMVLLMIAASAAGVVAAVLLAAVVPRRVLVPLAWTGTTAAVVGAVLWLRRLRPEQFVTATDPLALLAALRMPAAMKAGPLPARWALAPLDGGGLLVMTAATAASAVLVVAAWRLLAQRAAARLLSGAPTHARPMRLWAAADRLLVHGAVGTLVASRLRLLGRDSVQAAQTLYLIGLGVVYVQNLRALPLDDPLARELAGLINLAMAGLLAAALALRFAYPSQLLEGAAVWWWRTAPVRRRDAYGAGVAVALLPSLVLAGGLFAAAQLVIGPTRTAAAGWWLVPWFALWLSSVGVAMGPGADRAAEEPWLEAALGGGGLAFLAIAVAAVGWTVAAAGRAAIAEVVGELGGVWDPGFLAGRPAVPVLLLTVIGLPKVVSSLRGE